MPEYTAVKECAFDLLAARDKVWQRRMVAGVIALASILTWVLAFLHPLLILLVAVISPLMCGMCFLWVAQLHARSVLFRVSIDDLCLTLLSSEEFNDWLRYRSRRVGYTFVAFYFFILFSPFLIYVFVVEVRESRLLLLGVWGYCVSSAVFTAWYLSETAFLQFLIYLERTKDLMRAHRQAITYISVRYFSYLFFSMLTLALMPLLVLVFWTSERHHTDKRAQASLPNWWEPDREARHA